MFTQNLFAGRTVLVTGAGHGIGKEIALRVAELGADVGVNDIDEEAARETVDGIEERGQKAVAVVGDVSKTDYIPRMVDDVESELGVVQHVVNNAAKASDAPLVDLSMSEWRQAMRINVDAALEFSRTVAQRLIEYEEDGSIVNIASIAGVRPLPEHGAYTPSKAAIIKLTEQMALEWGEHGINVNAVCPGLIWTSATDTVYSDEELLEKRREWVPLERIGSPEDIARGTVFLLAPENNYTTGEAFFIDGGAQAVGMNLVPGRT